MNLTPSFSPAAAPRARRLALLTALPMLLMACASAPVPVQQLAVADAAVQRASTVQTRNDAPAELQLATTKLADAHGAVSAGDTERARRLAEEATVDAEAAEIHAQAVRSRKAAHDSEDAARALREEMNRKTPQ